MKARLTSNLRREAAILLLSLTLAQGASATVENDKSPIKIALGERPPLASADLPDYGPLAQLIREAYRLEGQQVELAVLPWPRSMQLVRDGHWTGSGIWLKNPKRETEFLFSQPVVEEHQVFFYRKNQPLAWMQLEDLSHLVLGGLQGFSYGAAFDSALTDGSLTMERERSDLQNFEKLLRNRIDAYPQELRVGLWVLGTLPRHSQEQIAYHPRPYLEEPAYLIFGLDQEAARDSFDRGLAKLKASGRAKELLDGGAAGMEGPLPRSN
ncbi:substrate-binding periplasmic protein [Hydrocarboniclastica marina]|uniref:Solute-binding protein family 3/N-terminal domain-containing protein n=1 Tax=Hydrocarboniclastica marina TaxID=2259620 RepID=A0A4P7XJ68_9ALTE|nr:transporter substrate-binding domain-containing protein [Hydrocarboniclastica marina]QCF26805.1 hypothetical protein soil367_13170 [Hydrocarboniclastica marina]